MDPGKKVVILKWEESGHPHEFELPEAGSISLGRHDCDITFEQQTVSRRHASITANGGRFVLLNLSKTNSVILNEEIKLRQGEESVLKAGDNFKLGPVQIAVSEKLKEMGRLALKCNNCGNINDYNPQDQCKFCGRNLSNGETIQIEE